MPLETPTTIKDLYANYPFDGDLVSQGRQHLINYKTAVVNTFPNITEAITVTETYLKNLLSKITFVDDSLVFNTPIYKRTTPPATTINTLRELYITKDQKLLVREPLPPLGTVIESVLSLVEMNGTYDAGGVQTKAGLYSRDKEGRDRWALLNGQTITGSKLQVEMNIASLPNTFANMVFLAAPKGTETLNTLYNFNTNVTPLKMTLKDEIHGAAAHESAHKHAYVREGNGTTGDRDNDYSTIMVGAWNQARSTNGPVAPNDIYTGYDPHNHLIIPVWGTETAPKAIKMNYFVRIN